MEVKKKIKKGKLIADKNAITISKSVSQFFGINKKEVDGLKFQKKIRK
jgi:hypothetical protein